MKLAGVELRRIRMPLVAPFRTSFGVESTRDILLLRVVASGPGGHYQGLAGRQVVFAHILLAAVNEVAMMIARADDPAAGLTAGESAIAGFLDRLLGATG